MITYHDHSQNDFVYTESFSTSVEIHGNISSGIPHRAEFRIASKKGWSKVLRSKKLKTMESDDRAIQSPAERRQRRRGGGLQGTELEGDGHPGQREGLQQGQSTPEHERMSSLDTARPPMLDLQGMHNDTPTGVSPNANGSPLGQRAARSLKASMNNAWRRGEARESPLGRARSERRCLTTYMPRKEITWSHT